MNIEWDVFLSTKAVKQKNKLSEDLQFVLLLLAEDLKIKAEAQVIIGLIMENLRD